VLVHAMHLNPDAVFLTGDFCASAPVQEIFHQLRARLDLLGVNCYLTPGNHDDREMLRNAFDLEGQNYEPIRGTVQVKNKDFLFLDSSTGKVNEEQIGWLTDALKAHPEATSTHIKRSLSKTFFRRAIFCWNGRRRVGLGLSRNM